MFVPAVRLAATALLALAALTACLPDLAAQDLRSGGPLIEQQACYDVRWYGLELEVFPDEKRIAGSLAMRADIVGETDTLVLDLHRALDVERIVRGDDELRFSHDDHRLTIALGETVPAGASVELRVDYGGRPRRARRPPWDGGFTWSETRDGRPWIATSCQGEGADIWWPCKDHPSDEPDTMDLTFTAPSDLVCASNGTLVSAKQSGPGKRTWHWQVANPINTYCVTLNLGPYEILKREYESVDGTPVPVFFWVLPRWAERAEREFDEFLDHLRHLEETCGPYPFRNEKYGIVQTPFLGMEHQTAIAYGNGFRKLSFDYDWLHHHELSHEWWGNLVSCADWKDMWIHEGIGTYMQALYIERRHGRQAYFAEMRGTRRQVVGRRPIAPREPTDSKEIYFGADGLTQDNDIYMKGSVVMHTLRWLLGDETFFIALRRLAYPDPALEKVTDGSQCRHEDTDGVREIVEDVSGLELEWFFDSLLHSGGLPDLRERRDGDVLELEWQAPGVEAFPLPVPVEIDGETTRVAMPDGRARVQLPSADARVVVDPEGWLLIRR